MDFIKKNFFSYIGLDKDEFIIEPKEKCIYTNDYYIKKLKINFEEKLRISIGLYLATGGILNSYEQKYIIRFTNSFEFDPKIFSTNKRILKFCERITIKTDKSRLFKIIKKGISITYKVNTCDLKSSIIDTIDSAMIMLGIQDMYANHNKGINIQTGDNIIKFVHETIKGMESKYLENTRTTKLTTGLTQYTNAEGQKKIKRQPHNSIPKTMTQTMTITFSDNFTPEQQILLKMLNVYHIHKNHLDF